MEVYVRFANEGVYYNKINVKPENVKDPQIFSDEVFCTIDGVRVAMKKSDWEDLIKDIYEKIN